MKLLALLLILPALTSGGPVLGSPQAPRAAHTATLLGSGEVLIAGGCTVNSCELDARGATTELYEPGSRRFREGPALLRPRVGHGAVRLGDGSVLVFGGSNGGRAFRSAELYDPAVGRFVATGSLRVARYSHSATLLPDGRVLVAGGGVEGRGVYSSVEIWNPRTGLFTPAAPLLERRHKHAAVAVRGRRARRRRLG